jgi:hypothetical protein
MHPLPATVSHIWLRARRGRWSFAGDALRPIDLPKGGFSMAYLDLDNMYAAPVASRCQASATTAPAGFSALEWSVIALAQRDTLGSLTEPSRMSRALGSLFGRGPVSRLADPKLEALRRAAVHARYRGFALPMSEIHHFHSAGFSEAQMETLITSVTGMRIGRGDRRLSA